MLAFLIIVFLTGFNLALKIANCKFNSKNSMKVESTIVRKRS